MEIVLAQIKDCEALSKLKQKVWSDTYRGIYSDDKLDDFNFTEHAEKFKKIILSNDKQLYIVKDQDEIIAYMSFGAPVRKFRDFKQEIGLLYIRNDYQGKGLGSRLFRLAKEGIAASGEKDFFISCNKYNANARKFYEKMGGTLIDEADDLQDKSNAQVKFLYQI